MSIFKVGQKVVWVDPEGLTSDVYEIVDTHESEGDPYDLITLTNGFSETEAYLCELQPIEDTKVCKHCGNLDITKQAWTNINGKSKCIDFDDNAKQYYCNHCEKIIIGDPINLLDFKLPEPEDDKDN